MLICLMGPTASGKTALAVELVQAFPCEIISVDSAMVYRGLDIGTAKPGPDILKRAPHRLLDLKDPADTYSAGDFINDAQHEITRILQAGKIPLLVGGSMLYFHLLQHGLDDLPEQNPEIRRQIQQEAEERGWDYLHQKLAAIDPVAAKRIHPNDSQRIQRALEVHAITGKTLTQAHLQSPVQHPYAIHNLILCPQDRGILHKRIEQRFLDMLAAGFLDEVRLLHQRGDLSLNKPAMRSVGYRQAWEHLEGQLSYEEMKEKAIIATRQLAKRQITWLQRWKQDPWLDSEESGLIEKVVGYLAPLIREQYNKDQAV